MGAPNLVTGGAGFIGSHLVQLLAQRGETVRVFELPGVPVEHLPKLNVEIVRGDVRDWGVVQGAVRGCRAVYHLAAVPQLWAQPRGVFHQINFRGAVHVMEMAHLAGVKRIVHVSSESLLAHARGTGAGPQFQAIAAADVIGPYGRAKFRAERHAFQMASRGVPIIVVSPTVPIGPWDLGRSPPTQMLLDYCRGHRHEYLDAELNLIDVRDVALGLIRALEVGVPGRRYILGHETISLRSLLSQLAELTGLPAPHRRVPYALALVAAYVAEWLAEVVTRRPPAATVAGVRLTRRLQPPDPHCSLAELGLQPRPVRQALLDTINWFHSVGWLQRSALSKPEHELVETDDRVAA